jgi:threonylcarbamoyladenosine tRNA methylthiotransferase MtaB
MPKFHIQTFGCRCNQADSAVIRHGLCGMSLQEAADSRDADLVVVNTCTVTHRSDQQVRQAVRKIHRDNPKARLVVTGCYAERDPAALAAIPGVNLVVGNADKDRLAAIISEQEGSSAWGRIVHNPLHHTRDLLIPSMSETGGKTRPFVKLQDGCDARCSYCVVPGVRGPGRSARPESVLAEVEALVRKGYQEIVLTGVHLGTWGRKFDEPASLADLVAGILRISGLGRVRLSSIEPMRFNRAIIRLASEHSTFARHFHIPLQSGSDRVLRRMRRPYTAARFLDLVEFIREQLPAAAIGTDVLVGFPGESQEDFERSCDTVRRAPLTYMHVFPFSARDGTDAFSMEDRVPPPVVRDRARIMRELSQAKNLQFRQSFTGQVLPGLTLAKEEEMGESVVLTDNYIHVRVPSHQVPPNRLVKVRITGATSQATFGEFAGETSTSRTLSCT